MGLALAKTVAAEQGGEVSWARIGDETVFTMSLLNASSPLANLDTSSLTVVASARETETETEAHPDCCVAKGLS